MNRRHFASTLSGLAATASLFAWPRGAQAQGGAPVEGKDFLRLKSSASPSEDGKIVVTEFFWYGCPHCYALEPSIEPWVKALPTDVRFRLVPYDFGAALRETHKQVFCTWEALGLVGAMHQKTWDRFHRQHKPVNSESDMLAFAADSGLDVAKVKQAWNSFGVQTKMRQATQLCEQFEINETPVLAIQDRFETTPARAGSGERALVVANSLIEMARKRG